MSIDTAIENMIQNHIELLNIEQDFVCRLDAEQYADNEVNDARADFEAELTELQHRIEALEEKEQESKAAAEPNLVQELVDSVEVKEEPRAVNQIDWIMTPSDMIAGYDSKAMLESYVRSCLHHDQTSQAEMIIAMVLATARNLINNKLESQS